MYFTSHDFHSLRSANSGAVATRRSSSSSSNIRSAVNSPEHWLTAVSADNKRSPCGLITETLISVSESDSSSEALVLKAPLKRLSIRDHSIFFSSPLIVSRSLGAFANPPKNKKKKKRKRARGPEESCAREQKESSRFRRQESGRRQERIREARDCLHIA